jgi:sugar phosphate isomerase/epimerase
MVLTDQPLTLSAGSMVRYSFTDYVDAAACAGFTAITVTKRLCYLAGRRQSLTVADMRAVIGDHGLRIAEVEGSPGWLRGPAPADDRVLSLDEALGLATAVGAPAVVAYHDDRPGEPLDRMTGDFAAACDRASDLGLTLALEFLPWTPVGTLRDALLIVTGAGRPNGRIVFDTWHHAHGTGQGADLTPGEAALISCVQLVDARQAETGDLMRETMFGRRVPGTGVLDLPALVAGLAAAGVECPVSVEVYDETYADLDARSYAQLLGTAARRLLRGER